MIQLQLAAPCDGESLDYMMATFDAILSIATHEFGPADVVQMLRDRADCIEAHSKMRMN